MDYVEPPQREEVIDLSKRTAMPEAPLYAGRTPGTQDWMDIWKAYPSLQTEMLTYQKLLNLGIHPIENMGKLDDVFRISNSGLEAGAKCSTMALLRYGYKVSAPGEGFAMQIGTAIHSAFNVLFREGDKPKAMEAFRCDFPKGIPPKDNYEYDNIHTIVSHLVETFQCPYSITPELVELWFEQKLHEDDNGVIALCGRVDAIPQDNLTKAFWCMDNKTTGKITEWWLKKFRLGSQLTGYVWAAERFMGQQMPGAIINAIELPKLPAPGRKCKTHGVDYSECRKFHPQHRIFQCERPPWMIENWKLDAVFQAKRLRDLIKEYAVAPEGIKYVRQQGSFTGACTFCDYIDFCLANRPVEWIGTILEKREDMLRVEG